MADRCYKRSSSSSPSLRLKLCVGSVARCTLRSLRRLLWWYGFAVDDKCTRKKARRVASGHNKREFSSQAIGGYGVQIIPYDGQNKLGSHIYIRVSSGARRGNTLNESHSLQEQQQWTKRDEL